MKAVFRCDATAAIGFGHLSRCIALAEAFRLFDVHSSFAGQFDPAADAQISSAGFRSAAIADLVHTPDGDRLFADMLSKAPADLILIDSYRANASYLSNLKATGAALVVIDDFAALEHYPCDVLLNFTWGARELGYQEGPVLLLGPEYFPARRRLVEQRSESMRRRRGDRVENVLIAVGGSDPKRIGARVIRLLRSEHQALRLRAVAANEADLEDPLTDFAPGSAVLPRQPDLSDQLLWADACITGGGLIKYESAFMGVPAAAISQNAAQAGESDVLAGAGLVFDLGMADDLDDAELAGAMNRFLNDDDLRMDLTTKVRGIFPADPSALAARAIVEAIGR